MIAAADIGGHTLTVGLTDGASVLRKKTVPTPERNPRAVCAAIAGMLSEMEAPDCAAVLCVPGMVADGRRVLNCPNQTGWDGMTDDLLSELLGRKVYLANDCDAAAMGEMACGAAAGLENFVYCTLGTGIGGSVIVNGRLVRGLHGRTGEFGHFPLLLDKGCGCGGRGHVECFFSADVFERAGEKYGYGSDMAELWENRENAWLARVFATGERALACAFASLTHLLDPEAIVVGGGLSKLDGLLDDIRDYMQPVLSPVYRPGPGMKLAVLGEDAPLIGAEKLAGAF